MKVDPFYVAAPVFGYALSGFGGALGCAIIAGFGVWNDNRKRPL